MQKKIAVGAALLLMFLFCLYSIFWINTAYELKHFVRMMISDFESRGYSVYYGDFKLGGYPFHYRIDITNLKVRNTREVIENGERFIEFKRFPIQADLKAKTFLIKITEPIYYHVLMQDDLLRYHSFLSKIHYYPRFQLALRQSLLSLFLKRSKLASFFLEISSIDYRDSGYEMLDELGSVLAANRGENFLKVNIKFDRENNKGIKIFRDVFIKADISSTPHQLDISEADDLYLPSFFKEGFSLVADTNVQVYANRYGSRETTAFLRLRDFLCSVGKANISVNGEGTFSMKDFLLGRFAVKIEGYEHFLSEFLSMIFADSLDSQVVRKAILDAAETVEEDHLSFVYQADGYTNARLGKAYLKDLVDLVLEKVEVDQSEIEAMKKELLYGVFDSHTNRVR